MKSQISNKFENTYNRESDAIFRFCLTRVSNRDQALDITQETFLRLWQSLANSKEIKNERAFLFTVCRNLIIDWYRKKKSVSLESMMQTEEGIEYEPVDEKMVNELEFGIEGRHLIDKINQLTPTHRDPVYLHFVEGLSPGEIGTILDISANATSVRIHRGLAELRNIAGYDKEN